MLGNDVVDLADPESDPSRLHPRFDRRVFDEDERVLLAGSPDPLRTRWHLWAAKEAAYKAARQGDRGIAFSPIRFAVRLAEGRVDHPRGRFRVSLHDRGEAVHVLAEPDPGPTRSLLVGLARVAPDEEPSRAVRRLARRELARHLGVAPERVRVGRRGRIPEARLDERLLPWALSLSHHGRFVALACRPSGDLP